MPGDHAAARNTTPARGVIDELAGVFAAVRTALADFLDLVSLEARRAGVALMWMLACGIVAAACIVSAWLGLMAALVIGAVSLGFPLPAAVIVVALMNGAAGAALIYRGIGISRDLLFSATRRQLAGKSRSVPVAP
ncbi:MAG: hypothetical protein K2X06_02040 [Burkholderiales bacterium]|nr:hypothetical protein [Burkholderiales bacterium]